MNCKGEVDKWKKIHKYYSLNACEPLEIDTIPYISKNFLQQYLFGLSRHTQKQEWSPDFQLPKTMDV